MPRRRRETAPDPLDARLDRIRAVWALMAITAPDSRERFLAKLDEIGLAWTGYCWQPEYAPAQTGESGPLSMEVASGAVPG